MTYKTHLSAGLLFSAIVFILIYKIELSPFLAAIIIFSTVIGSSAPDLDTPSGELWDKVPAGSVISHLVRPVFIGGHRHLSHSFLGFGLFALLFWALERWLGLFLPIIHNSHFMILAFSIGYFSHLLADSFTEAGVPLLFPLEYRFGIPPDPLGKVRIKTGKWFENLVIYPFVNLALIYIVFLYLRRFI